MKIMTSKRLLKKSVVKSDSVTTPPINLPEIVSWETLFNSGFLFSICKCKQVLMVDGKSVGQGRLQ